MIALFSALLGFVASITPKFFDASQDKRDKAQEVTLLEKQIELGKLQADANLKQTLVQADATTMAATQASFQTEVTEAAKMGLGFIVALSASVRPVITYAFFGLYFLVKCAQFYLVVDPLSPWEPAGLAQALLAIWSEEDMALFSAVIAFWFGNRTLNK